MDATSRDAIDKTHAETSARQLIGAASTRHINTSADSSWRSCDTPQQHKRLWGVNGEGYGAARERRGVRRWEARLSCASKSRVASEDALATETTRRRAKAAAGIASSLCRVGDAVVAGRRLRQQRSLQSTAFNWLDALRTTGGRTTTRLMFCRNGPCALCQTAGKCLFEKLTLDMDSDGHE